MFDALPYGTPLAIRLRDAHTSGGFRPLLLNERNEQQENSVPAAHLDVQHADQYARGFADGERGAQENAAAERLQYNALIASANAIQSEASDELAALIRAAILHLVESIVGKADVDDDWLKSKIACAVSIVSECDTARTLWVHPDDHALIDDGTIGLKIMTDPDALRGSIRVECSQGWIEHGRSIYLDKLRDQLGPPEKVS